MPTFSIFFSEIESRIHSLMGWENAPIYGWAGPGHSPGWDVSKLFPVSRNSGNKLAQKQAPSAAHNVSTMFLAHKWALILQSAFIFNFLRQVCWIVYI